MPIDVETVFALFNFPCREPPICTSCRVAVEDRGNTRVQSGNSFKPKEDTKKICQVWLFQLVKRALIASHSKATWHLHKICLFGNHLPLTLSKVLRYRKNLADDGSDSWYKEQNRQLAKGCDFNWIIIGCGLFKGDEGNFFHRFTQIAL